MFFNFIRSFHIDSFNQIWSTTFSYAVLGKVFTKNHCNQIAMQKHVRKMFERKKSIYNLDKTFSFFLQLNVDVFIGK